MKRLAALWVIGACACAPFDVVVADVHSEDGGHPHPELACVTNGDCRPNDFCELAGCAATVGKCRPRPAFCPPDPNPTCGCDDVNYWNDCLRKQEGVGASTAGECSNPAACSSCPQASCAVLLLASSACAAPPSGVCWVVPSTCPMAIPGMSEWKSCSGAPGCSDLCTAIRSGAPRLRATSCP